MENTHEEARMDEILSHICGSCTQLAIDFTINCIRHNDLNLAKNVLWSAGIGQIETDIFIIQVQKHINEDKRRVKNTQQCLSFTDEEIIDLAETILRVLK